jgi:hypothetical protein
MTTGPRNNRLSRIRLRWHLASPLFRLLTQAGVVAVAAVVGFAFLSIGNAINETAASVLVAVVFGVATVLQLRQAQRRQYTVGLLMNLQSTLTLSAADMWMAQRIASHREIDDEVSTGDMQHVIALLDYYEFLSVLAFRGFVEIPLLISLRGGAMTRCYDLCHSYITTCRSEIGSELYIGLETFVDEYARHVKHQVVTPAATLPDTLGGASPTTTGEVRG